MASEKHEIVYNGELEEIWVTGIGTFRRGEPTSVSRENEERLLTHPDFNKTTTAHKKEADE